MSILFFAQHNKLHSMVGAARLADQFFFFGVDKIWTLVDPLPVGTTFIPLSLSLGFSDLLCPTIKSARGCSYRIVCFYSSLLHVPLSVLIPSPTNMAGARRPPNQPGEPSVKTLLKEVGEAAKQQKYGDVIEKAKTILQRDPKSYSAYVSVGRLCGSSDYLIR